MMEQLIGNLHLSESGWTLAATGTQGDGTWRLVDARIFKRGDETLTFSTQFSAMLGLYVDVRAAEGVEQELLAGHGVVVAIQQAPPTEVMVEVFCGHAVETVHPGF